MRVKYNDHLEDLYCIDCKNLIEIGNKYIEAREYYLNERIVKCYHVDCCPVENEDEINDSFDRTQEVNFSDDLEIEEDDD